MIVGISLREEGRRTAAVTTNNSYRDRTAIWHDDFQKRSKVIRHVAVIYLPPPPPKRRVYVFIYVPPVPVQSIYPEAMAAAFSPRMPLAASVHDQPRTDSGPTADEVLTGSEESQAATTEALPRFVKRVMKR